MRQIYIIFKCGINKSKFHKKREDILIIDLKDIHKAIKQFIQNCTSSEHTLPTSFCEKVMKAIKDFRPLGPVALVLSNTTHLPHFSCLFEPGKAHFLW